MAIDYERQFTDLNPLDLRAVDLRWLQRRSFSDPRQAFESARRTEARGIAVAFAKSGDTYYVWTGEKE